MVGDKEFMVAWASLSVYSRPLPSEKIAPLQPC